MILKPTEIRPDNSVYPSDEELKITWKNNGDIMVAFEISVYNNLSGTPVYMSGKIASYICSHIIPGNIFTNGEEYKYKIKVYNSANSDVDSDYKVFKCSYRPDVSIITDGTIRNQTCSIKAVYSQTENVPIKAYRFILYDEYNNVLEQCDYIYNKYDNRIEDEFGYVVYEVSHTFDYKLVDNTNYKVECVVVDQNDLIATGDSIVLADYIPPSVHFSLEAKTYMEKPYVELNWTTVRILGKTDYDPIYIGDTLDLTNNRLYFDEGFSLDGNFTIRLWITNVPEETVFANFIIDGGNIQLVYYGNKIHAFKIISNYTTHIVADNEFDLLQQDVICIILRQINKKLDIKCEVLI